MSGLSQRSPVKNNLSKKSKGRKLETIHRFNDGLITSGGQAAGTRSPVMTVESLIQTARNYQPNTLVIQSILKLLCKQLEPDDQRAQLLYESILRQLRINNLLVPTTEMPELQGMQNSFTNKFERLILFTQRRIQDQLTNSSLVPGGKRLTVPLSIRSLSNEFGDGFLQHSRYKNEFEELENLGSGGFGVVCKARNRLDKKEYAVKKIMFFYEKHKTFHKMLREVEALANLSHHNVVGYNTCWIEDGAASGFSAPSHSLETSDTSSRRSVADKNMFVRHLSTVEIREIIDTYSSNESGDRMQGGTLEVVDSVREVSNSTSSSTHNSSTNQRTGVVSHNNKKKISKMSMDSSSSSICFQQTVKDEVSEEAIDLQRNGKRLIGQADDDVIPTDNSLALVSNHKLQRGYMRSISLEIVKADSNKSKLKKEYGVLFIQMELCSSSLANWLKQRNFGLSHQQGDVLEGAQMKEVLLIFQQIVQGVHYIHNNGLIHRDLKPKNIFISHDGRVKIGDFGLAREVITPHVESVAPITPIQLAAAHNTGRVGTVIYAAPEQIHGSTYGQKADMYSLGIILLEMIHPFTTSMAKQKCIEAVRKGNIPELVTINWPLQAKWIGNLTNATPSARPSAQDVLTSDLLGPTALSCIHSWTDDQPTVSSVPGRERVTSQFSVSQSSPDSTLSMTDIMIELELLRSRNAALEAENRRLVAENSRLESMKGRNADLETENRALKLQLQTDTVSLPGLNS